ncbi:DNA-binding protein D-ETS-3-like isoform X3 [Haliotis rufescens]|uniref:DNA-binding protein D-ETS-3-like isoform X3 n=1 Tax=Haliotis rufescens TaxID=6454 RepID=UPI00201EAEC4|nr:DNA-binding protein D-ETS-3-like isoform X3 [Haliotis rufescens]
MDNNPIKTDSASYSDTYSPATMNAVQSNPQFHMSQAGPHMMTHLIPVTSHLPPQPESTAGVSQAELEFLVSCLTKIACFPIGYGTEQIESGNIPLFEELIDSSDMASRPDNPTRSNIETASYSASTSEMETAARFVQELLHPNPQTETQNPHSGRQDFTQTRHSGIPTSSSPIGQGHQVGSQSPQFEGQISPYGGQSPPFSGQGSQSAMEFYYPVVENPDHRSSPQMLPVIEMGFPQGQGQGQGQCYMHDPGATSQEGQPRLWKFILDLLEDPRYNPSYIAWVNRQEGIFRLIDPQRLAELWGHVKGNKSMNYEKLSRGLRYYYTHNVLEHVPGKLVYKFSQGAQVWQYLSQTSMSMTPRTVSSTVTSQCHYPPHTSY